MRRIDRIEYLISNKFLDLCLSHSSYPGWGLKTEKLRKNNDENIIYLSDFDRLLYAK